VALKESQADEQRSRDESIARLQAEYDRGQSRLDAMYLDKLDGRIEAAYFDHKATEWGRDLDGLAASIREHRSADRRYLNGGVRLLELAAHAHEFFLSQAPGEKRKLLNFVVANASWSGGHLFATLGQPFSLISELAPRPDSDSTGT
jgi:site-specific DNA recombinase